MSSDYDFSVKALFDEAKTDVPDEAFVRLVMKSVRREQRMADLLRLAGLVSVLAFLWLAWPSLEGLVVSVNGIVGLASDRTVTLLTDMGSSPVTWIFVIPPVAYYVYRNRRRLI